MLITLQNPTINLTKVGGVEIKAEKVGQNWIAYEGSKAIWEAETLKELGAHVCEVPAIAKDMRRVTYEEFFARMGPLNVHPSVQGSGSNPAGYHSEWRLANGRDLVGVTDGGTYLCAARYWLRS